MSFLRFEQGADGIHVVFFDVDNPGPVGTVSSFEPHDVATITRGEQHAIRLEMEFVDGAGNDVVEVFVDGDLEFTGTSWEDYHRFDPEAAAGGNLVPTVDSALFRISGTAAPANAGQGFLVDGFRLNSATPTRPLLLRVAATGGPGGGKKKKKKCKKKVKKGAGAAKREEVQEEEEEVTAEQALEAAPPGPRSGARLFVGALFLAPPRPPGRGFFTSGSAFDRPTPTSESEETWPQTCESV